MPIRGAREIDYTHAEPRVLASRMPEILTMGTPERAKTDKNLDAERKNADQVLAEHKAAVEADANRVLQLAREHADAVLHAARDKADDKLESVKPVPVIRAVIEQERRIEDRVVEHERGAVVPRRGQDVRRSPRSRRHALPCDRRGGRDRGRCRARGHRL